MTLPAYAVHTTVDEDTQVRLLLMGPPKAGKTYSASTFPKPLFVDFDNGLTSKDLRAKKLALLPFYDEAWLRKSFPKVHPSATIPVKPASAFVAFLNSPDIMHLDKDSTLVIDSLSTLSDAVKAELTPSIPRNDKGIEDTFWFWRQWSNWFCALCTKLKSLPCHVVLIAHEQEVRDPETGRVVAYKLALQGQEFSPRLPQFFSDIYRQTKETQALPGGTELDKTTKRVKEIFLWQIKSSPQFICNTRMNTDKQYVTADFKSFNY